MTITNDALGTWRNLGSVQAIKKQWRAIPTTAIGGNATLRASFLCSDWNKLSSYILIRPCYNVGASNQVGSAIRLYPSSSPIIFELPIPAELKDKGLTARILEIYKVGRYYRYIGITPDAVLEVRLEELWDSPI